MKSNQQESAKGQPNVIVILADDMGYGDLSGFGSELINTPNIDELASNGVALTNYYAPSPICSPSRAGLLTGRYPVRSHVPSVFMHSEKFRNKAITKLLTFSGAYSYGMQGISHDEVLLSEALQAADYETALIGKWHLGDHVNDRPNKHGFDYFYGALYSNDMQPYEIYRNEEVDLPEPVDQSVLTKNLTVESIQFITENKEKPFFLYYASPFPHDPALASQDFAGTSKAGTYGDTVQELDWSVGEIMKSLEENGIADNTLVIFSSDNGPWFEGNAGQFRSRKGSNFDGGNKVPFIAWMPEKIKQGSVSDALASGIDIYPTILQMLDIELPQDRIIDGVDMMPILRGDNTVSIRDELFLFKAKKPIAVVNGQYKYYRRTSSDIGFYWLKQQGPFLFDLKQDQAESYDVKSHQSEKAQELSKKLDQFEQEIQNNLRGWIE
ncbi:sulfatase [Alteromonas sp. M12]|uniref:sulfatase family protein n=1 Tax=Alteromonas sp. M12 TaxID=3135644 RepID=UPI00319E8BBA